MNSSMNRIFPFLLRMEGFNSLSSGSLFFPDTALKLQNSTLSDSIINVLYELVPTLHWSEELMEKFRPLRFRVFFCLFFVAAPFHQMEIQITFYLPKIQPDMFVIFGNFQISALSLFYELFLLLSFE